MPDGFESFKHKSQPAYTVKIWEQASAERFCDSLRAFDERVGAHPARGFFDTSETSYGDLLPKDLRASHDSGYVSIVGALASMAYGFPVVNVNFSRSAKTILSLADGLGVGQSYTDAKPTSGGDESPAGQLRIAQASMDALTQPGATMESVLAWAELRNVRALAWVDWMKAPFDWAAVKNFTAAHPL